MTELTRDAVLGGRLSVLQPASGYRVAIDPVLLAAAVPARNGDRAVDLGCGVGTAGLCLAARLPGVAVAGFDLDPANVDLARRNAADAGLAQRAAFACGDVADGRLPFPAASFDHAMANPPYGRADRSGGAGGSPAATIEGKAGIADWVAAATRLVRARGSVTFVFGADRLDELLAAMGEHLGSLIVFPLWPTADGRPAKRVLVRGIRGGRAPLILAAGLVLHQPGGAYTDAAEAVLRGGARLRLSPRDPT